MNSTLPQLGLLTLLSLGACSALAPDALRVTPQRPTYSSDTGTTAEGSFELETGVQIDPGDSFATPTTIKYGIGERSEAFLGLSPYNLVARPGEDGAGFGDTLVGMRHRFWEDSAGSTAAFQFASKIPTADEDEGLGSGELDFFASAILTHQLDASTALTAYYELDILGNPNGAGTATQHGFALAASRSVHPDFSVFAELAGVYNREERDTLFTTFGVTHTIAPNLVLDVGLALGVNRHAPDAQLVLGMTRNLGRASEPVRD